MESALRDSWEDLHHGVRPVRVVHVHEVDHFCAVGHKDATEEEVDEVDLTDHIDDVEQVAEEISRKILDEQRNNQLQFVLT